MPRKLHFYLGENLETNLPDIEDAYNTGIELLIYIEGLSFFVQNLNPDLVDNENLSDYLFLIGGLMIDLSDQARELFEMFRDGYIKTEVNKNA